MKSLLLVECCFFHGSPGFYFTRTSCFTCYQATKTVEVYQKVQSSLRTLPVELVHSHFLPHFCPSLLTLLPVIWRHLVWVFFKTSLNTCKSVFIFTERHIYAIYSTVRSHICQWSLRLQSLCWSWHCPPRSIQSKTLNYWLSSFTPSTLMYGCLFHIK